MENRYAYKFDVLYKDEIVTSGTREYFGSRHSEMMNAIHIRLDMFIKHTIDSENTS